MGYASGHYDREMAVGIAAARAAAMVKADGNGAMVAHGVQGGERVQSQTCACEEEEGWGVHGAWVQRCGWFEWAGGVYDGRVCCIEWGE